MPRICACVGFGLLLHSLAAAGEPHAVDFQNAHPRDARTGMELYGGILHCPEVPTEVHAATERPTKGFAFAENFPLLVVAGMSVGTIAIDSKKGPTPADKEVVSGRVVLGASGLHLLDHLKIDVLRLDQARQVVPVRLVRTPWAGQHSNNANSLTGDVDVLEGGDRLEILFAMTAADGGPLEPGEYQVQAIYDTTHLPPENPIDYVYVKSEPYRFVVRSSANPDPVEFAAARIALDWHRRPHETWEALSTLVEMYPGSMRAASLQLGYLMALGAFEKAWRLNRDLVERVKNGALDVDYTKDPLAGRIPLPLFDGMVGAPASSELESVLARVIRIREAQDPGDIDLELRFLREHVERLVERGRPWFEHTKPWEDLTDQELAAVWGHRWALKALLGLRGTSGSQLQGGALAALDRLIDEMITLIWKPLKERPEGFPGDWRSLESLRADHIAWRAPLLQALNAQGGLREDMRATLSPEELKGHEVHIGHPNPSPPSPSPPNGTEPSDGPRSRRTGSRQPWSPTVWVALGLFVVAIAVSIFALRRRR